jgi:uncharacterized low-complexity protein
MEMRMSSKTSNSTVLMLGATLAGGLVLGGSAFAMEPLAQGYMLAGASVAEGSCGADHAKTADQKATSDKMAGEGKCGLEVMDTDKDGRVSSNEYAAAHKGDTSKFAEHDSDKDGYLSAEELKVHMGGAGGMGGPSNKMMEEGKCGEGRCGASS